MKRKGAVAGIAVLPGLGRAAPGVAWHLRPDAPMVVLVGWIRVTNVITGTLVITATGHHVYSDVAEQWLLLSGATVWTVIMFRAARRAGRFSRGWAWADVAVAMALLVLVTRTCVPAERLSWGNWAFTFGLSSALIAGAACGVTECTAMTALLLASFMAALLLPVAAHPLQVTNLIGNPLEFVWFAALAFLAVRYLRRVETRLHAAVTAQISSESRTAALRASHYAILHDTVLPTLTAIARGGLDHRIPEVRARCAREADYLRRLVHSDLGQELTPVPGLSHALTPVPDLGYALSEVAGEAEELGLRVHYATDSLPELPAPAVTALTQAAREALNNVRLHSGTLEAWVTAVGEGATVQVTIVDRGRGFDQRQLTAGFGLRRSIIGRLAEADGSAQVISAAGSTSVELRWPAR
jgi:signal transduction histidine kinase